MRLNQNKIGLITQVGIVNADDWAKLGSLVNCEPVEVFVNTKLGPKLAQGSGNLFAQC